jgi:hypothetical protein
MYETKNFTLRPIGSSDDLRTNVWRVYCNKCGKWFSPPTTMMAVQLVECANNKCDNSEIINYNEL